MPYYHAIDSLEFRLDTKGYRDVFRKAVDKKDLKKVTAILGKLSYTEEEQEAIKIVYIDYFAGRL